MASSRRIARRRTAFVGLMVGATLAVAVVPASASFPDQGSRVLFARVKGIAAAATIPARGSGVIDLFTMKQNGDDVVRVIKTDTIQEYGGHWSPNGSRVTFSGLKGKGQYDVYTAMADGTKRKQLTTTATNYGPNWSKNGAQIVWTRFSGTFTGARLSPAQRRGTGANLMVMDADGSGKHSIFSGLALAPAWSPTTARIAFSTSDGDSLAVWWIKPSGLDPEPLASFGVGTYSLFGDWAPDGDSYLFAFDAVKMPRGPASSYDLYRGTPQGSKPIFLASDLDPQFSPMFTADGSRAIFVRYDGHDYELFSVRADGSGGERQLTDNGTDDILSVVPLV
jgi:Tol biopolymer transport system component